jgi:hypothetical protein
VQLRCACAVLKLPKSVFTIHFRCRVQQPADAPSRASSRFSGGFRARDGKDLKLCGLLPEAYEVDMLESDVKRELLEFGLAGGPLPYPVDALWKEPCW